MSQSLSHTFREAALFAATYCHTLTRLLVLCSTLSIIGLFTQGKNGCLLGYESCTYLSGEIIGRPPFQCVSKLRVF